MPQFINKIMVPSLGSIRHIVGFGQGDPGYDVLETTSKDNVPSVVYYYIKSGIKHSVSVTKYQKKYFVEYETYNGPDSLVSYQKKSCTLNSVSRDFLTETVMAYRAYRTLLNEYTSFRDDIMDALNGLECVYLGAMAKDTEHLKDILERSGFHVESVNFGMIKTTEGICLSFDGLCFNEDQIIP
jgi:hypothetical protein